jgi:SAM-dependent methyltransferase
MTRSAEIESQAAFHRQLFAGWYQWEEFWKVALELVGDKEDAIRLGLDQLGHFGPRGVALVADRLVSAADGELTRVVELGSGFGGALRHMGRQLASLGMRPWLIGIEFVPEHCELATAIGRSLGDTTPLFLNADARKLPFSPADVDAIFVVGSAADFSAMSQVLAECQRVLRLGGVLVMAEELSLRPSKGPKPGDEFVRYHPPEIFYAASLERRRSELEEAGLAIETFESLVPWAVPLLRQRVNAFRFMEHCAIEMFGPDSYKHIISMLTCAADEYERGAIQPSVIVARRVK